VNLHLVDFEVLEKRARRARAEAVQRLLIQPVVAFLRDPLPAARAMAAVLSRAAG
jgi:hypothetical protein